MILLVESIDRLNCVALTASGRLFESLSIFDETSDMGVFESTESNGEVRIFLKLIFVVELSFASVGATSATMTSHCG